jgi:hypothetical protein
MSTRSTTHFIYGDESNPVAIVYRHSDGYPEGAGVDLLSFLKKCDKLADSRLNDAAYLAAKYVVFLAAMFNRKYERNTKTGKLGYKKAKSPLDFISVGVVGQDPSDIEYRYVVDCENSVKGFPTVTCYKVNCSYPENKWSKKVVSIPVK